MTNAHHQRGQILLEQGRHADAERELRQALAIEPESAELHLKLGLACMGQERWRDAMYEAERVIALEPDAHHGFTLKGHSLLRLDQAAKARECLKQGLVHDPENAHIYGLLAATFSAQKRWKEARESAHAGLQLDPEDQDCLNQLALANTQLGDHAAAEEGLAAALQQDPDNALTHANRGWSLLRQARYREAMDAYREALRLDPTLEHARSGLIEAIKGQNPAYALFLRYFLFLTRLRPGVMLAIMIGTVLLRQLLMEVAEQVPAIAIPVMIVFWGLVAFIISSWIAIPLFNATLLLHPLGRHAISRGERIQSLGLLAILAAAAAAAVIWLTGSLAAGIAAMFILALSIPMTKALTPDLTASSRWICSSIAIAFLLLGSAAWFTGLRATQHEARALQIVHESGYEDFASYNRDNGWHRLNESQSAEFSKLNKGRAEELKLFSNLTQAFIYAFVAFTWFSSFFVKIRT